MPAAHTHSQIEAVVGGIPGQRKEEGECPARPQCPRPRPLPHLQGRGCPSQWPSMEYRVAGRPRVPAGTQAALGSSGALGGAAGARPSHHGPRSQSSRGAAAPSARALRERGARPVPDEAPRGARGTQTPAPACVTGAAPYSGPPGPVPAPHRGWPRPRASARWCRIFWG